jgi:hypothetical protein
MMKRANKSNGTTHVAPVSAQHGLQFGGAFHGLPKGGDALADHGAQRAGRGARRQGDLLRLLHQFLQHGEKQLVFAAEIIIQHRLVHVRFAGDVARGGGSDAVARQHGDGSDDDRAPALIMGLIPDGTPPDWWMNAG